VIDDHRCAIGPAAPVDGRPAEGWLVTCSCGYSAGNFLEYQRAFDDAHSHLDSVAPWTVDRVGWAAGPWDGEPDYLAWTYRGVHCLIVRSEIGVLCGYVAVAPGHPWHGKGRSEIDARVHDGVSYAKPGDHPVGEGENDSRWWVGFTCCERNDVIPQVAHLMVMRGGREYRDVAFVRAQVERLADQAIAAVTS
jgi:hypothetical protein